MCFKAKKTAAPVAKTKSRGKTPARLATPAESREAGVINVALLSPLPVNNALAARIGGESEAVVILETTEKRTFDVSLSEEQLIAVRAALSFAAAFSDIDTNQNEVNAAALNSALDGITAFCDGHDVAIGFLSRA